MCHRTSSLTLPMAKVRGSVNIKILTAEPHCRENSYRGPQGPHIEGVWAYLE